MSTEVQSSWGIQLREMKQRTAVWGPAMLLRGGEGRVPLPAAPPAAVKAAGRYRQEGKGYVMQASGGREGGK